MTKKTKKPKHYYVCKYEAPNRWRCIGILDNGVVFGENTCTRPGFAYIDLYHGRPDVQHALKKVFKIETLQVADDRKILVYNLTDFVSAITAIRAKTYNNSIAKLCKKYEKTVSDWANREKTRADNKSQVKKETGCLRQSAQKN